MNKKLVHFKACQRQAAWSKTSANATVNEHIHLPIDIGGNREIVHILLRKSTSKSSLYNVTPKEVWYLQFVVRNGTVESRKCTTWQVFAASWTGNKYYGCKMSAKH